jgi:glycolate oxidase
MEQLVEQLRTVIGADQVLTGDSIKDDYSHDEALGSSPRMPALVVLPSSTDDVAAIMRVASEHLVPVTPRGSGTGLSGAAIPAEGGIVISFERMNRVLEIDTENHIAVVQPGLTLAELDEITAAHQLIYPVFPGEYSASLGGNVATNAGGMRAVKYGVTRHQVLGLEVVLADGRVMRTGGKFVKSSTGYDLTQLIVGSEGTLAIVTEATLRLYPRLEHQATVVAPFTTLEAIMDAVPPVVASGIGPLILEYIDVGTMRAVTSFVGFDLGVPDDVVAQSYGYLVVMMENHHADRLEQDVQALGEHLAELGAIDVYVLPSSAATQLITAREKAFWVAKSNGADDIVDIVVPRASIASFMTHVGELAATHGAFVAGCGHAGDGNVHLSVFQPDPEVRSTVMRGLFELGLGLGGAISGEHGIGTTKKKYLLELEDPTKLELLRAIKHAFDPDGILNPETSL